MFAPYLFNEHFRIGFRLEAKLTGQRAVAGTDADVKALSDPIPLDVVSGASGSHVGFPIF
jgi:hypothetical protein